MQGIIIENISNLYRVKPIHLVEEKVAKQTQPQEQVENFPKETRNQWGKKLGEQWGNDF